MKNTILEIFGKNTLQNVVSFPMGFLGNMSLNRSNKDGIFIFINNRPVKSKIIETAIIDAYYTKLMKGRFPFAILFLEINPSEVDVNVHPSKKIVKFSDEERIYNLVYEATKDKISGDDDFVAPQITESSGRNFLNADNYKNLENKSFKSEVIKTEQNFLNPEEFYKKDFVVKENFTPVVEDKIETQNNLINVEKNSKSVFSNFEKTDKLVSAENKTKDYKIIGQFANSFVIIERNNVLEIYDQHIIHERILYEKLKKEYENKNISVQQLLVPVKFSVSYKDREIIENNLEILNNFGFDIDFFEKNDILIRAVPNMKFLCSIEELVRNIIEDLKNANIKNSLIEDSIIMASCKGAIKVNHPLNNVEIQILLDKLFEINEYTCPHGRPILLKLTLNDIEKLFNRK